MKVKIRKRLSGWAWGCPSCEWAEGGFVSWRAAFGSATDHREVLCLDMQMINMTRHVGQS